MNGSIRKVLPVNNCDVLGRESLNHIGNRLELYLHVQKLYANNPYLTPEKCPPSVRRKCLQSKPVCVEKKQ